MEEKNSILRIFNYVNVKKFAGIKKELRHNIEGCKKEKEILEKHAHKIIEALKNIVK